MLPTEIPCENDGELYDYYLNSNWGSSDIDLFIYGLNPEQTEQKVHFLNVTRKLVSNDQLLDSPYL